MTSSCSKESPGNWKLVNPSSLRTLFANHHPFNLCTIKPTLPNEQTESSILAHTELIDISRLKQEQHRQPLYRQQSYLSTTASMSDKNTSTLQSYIDAVGQDRES